jgi:endoglucanase
VLLPITISMAFLHRPRRLLTFAALAAALVAAGLLAAQGGHAQPLPNAVPALPDTSQLAVWGAMRDCRRSPRLESVPFTADPRGVDPSSPNPLAGLTFFVDPTEPAWLKWHSYRRHGMAYKAGLMWKVASQPRFRWFGRFTRPRMEHKVRDFLNCVQATQPGSVPEMVVLRAEANRCSRNYTGGGRAEDARTRRWYRKFAAAVGSSRVVIAFEPDSLGTIDCLARSRRMARMRLLRYGVKVLSGLPNATIYLEAGASDWDNARHTAWQLRYIGIRRVRGFMLNTTHYDWTANNIRHGRKISRLTRGKHFIISTAMNGRGPIHYRKYYGPHLWRVINVWCNPPGRGLGIPPTTLTGDPKVDGFLWVGRPGESGGSCNGGPLPVGTFWPERALMLAKFATTWLRRPR